MEWINAKCSGITKNEEQSGECSPKVEIAHLSALRKYCDVSGFPTRLNTICIYLLSTSGSFLDA